MTGRRKRWHFFFSCLWGQRIKIAAQQIEWWRLRGGRVHPSWWPRGSRLLFTSQMRVPSGGQAQTRGEGWVDAHHRNEWGSSQLRPVLSGPGAARTPLTPSSPHTHITENLGSCKERGRHEPRKEGQAKAWLPSWCSFVFPSSSTLPGKEWEDHGVSARLIWVPTLTATSHSVTSDKLMGSESASSGQALAENTHFGGYRGDRRWSIQSLISIK